MLTRDAMVEATAAHAGATMRAVSGCLNLLFEQLADLNAEFGVEQKDEACQILSWLIAKLHREQEDIQTVLNRPSVGGGAA